MVNSTLLIAALIHHRYVLKSLANDWFVFCKFYESGFGILPSHGDTYRYNNMPSHIDDIAML